jgi:catechol 2,3-dioxygenase-like lactoylglutathione lyase family enzyme
MTLQLRRIILFTADIQRLASFYQEVLGLPVVSREPGWVDLDAGGCRLAIHGGGAASLGPAHRSSCFMRPTSPQCARPWSNAEQRRWDR